MRLDWLWRMMAALLARQHGHLKRFDQALRTAGELTGRSDAGLGSVPVAQIVGSVGRWQSLRGDFLPRTPPALTERHRRIAEAMQTGQVLPPVELYRLVVRRADRPDLPASSEYYVVDGHHRVAMARRLGQVYLDAHIVEYRVAVHPCNGIVPVGPDGPVVGWQQARPARRACRLRASAAMTRGRGRQPTRLVRRPRPARPPGRRQSPGRIWSMNVTV